jgi:preprotein translocase subunit SecA
MKKMMFKKIFGGMMNSNEGEIDRIKPLVTKIKNLESEFERLSDAELKAKTAEFRTRIDQACAGKREEVENARRELNEKRKCESSAENAIQQEELSRECKDLEKEAVNRDKELKNAEKQILDDILPEAFAAVREAAKRTIHQRHFDVQMIGGIVLHHGKIAEMKTGEGKTLVATCPLYLNSLTGRGAHLITVNDYLARRDPYWMGAIFTALGVTVASIYPQQTPDEHTPSRLYDPAYDSGDKLWTHFKPISRKEAYEADITYGTSSEFGFDHLRDNMVIDLNQCVQRPLNFGIVDEVDNLLIDEARTPLIISGTAEEAGDLYKSVNSVVSRMKVKLMPHEPVTAEEKAAEEDESVNADFDYIAYEKDHSVKETTRGQEKLSRAFGMREEDLFGGSSETEIKGSFEETKKRHDILSIFRKAMQAHALYKKDRDYVVNDQGEVIIVDEFTGRLMLGRRYSEGLHQAIEAKEGVKVQRESLTYATITIQNYFRMYSKLAGMTGTAVTEAEEFNKIYKLDVVVIPTNKSNQRTDYGDRIYRDEQAKFNAVAEEIQALNQTGQPTLIGTVSIEKSERLGELLRKKGIKFNILNAKNHEKESLVIADAGKPGTVTVATNMAGRGVDILLGGKEPKAEDFTSPGEYEKAHKEWQDRHEKVIALGGLHVIGTERHEARRIDNQLRGRSGRQGDPGSSRFYVALDDDIMRRFGGDRIKTVLNWVKMDPSIPIENSMVSKTIENSQIKVEGYHFDIRKHLVEFDDVVNKHRELIYAERRKVLSGADLKANIMDMLQIEIKKVTTEYIGNRSNDEWNVSGLFNALNSIFPVAKDLTAEHLAALSSEEIEIKVSEAVAAAYEEKERTTGPQDMRLLERLVMLRIIDSLWVEHLTAMENARQESNWQTLRQIKAVDAYKRQGYQNFQILLDTIRQEVARMIFHVNIKREEDKKISTPISRAAGSSSQAPKTAPKTGGQKIGRNDPCYCGSGKKYKHCHGV